MKKVTLCIVLSGLMITAVSCSRSYVSQQPAETGSSTGQPDENHGQPSPGMPFSKEQLLTMAKENPKATAGAGVGIAGIVWLVVDFIQSKIRGDKMATVKAGQWVGRKAKGQIPIQTVRNMDLSSNSPYIYGKMYVSPSKYAFQCKDKIAKATISDEAQLPAAPLSPEGVKWEDEVNDWMLDSGVELETKSYFDSYTNVTSTNICRLLFIFDKAFSEQGKNLDSIALKTTDTGRLPTKWLSEGYQWTTLPHPNQEWSILTKTGAPVSSGGGQPPQSESVREFQDRVRNEMVLDYVVAIPKKLLKNDDRSVFKVEDEYNAIQRKNNLLPPPLPNTKWIAQDAHSQSFKLVKAK